MLISFITDFLRTTMGLQTRTAVLMNFILLFASFASFAARPIWETTPNIHPSYQFY